MVRLPELREVVIFDTSCLLDHYRVPCLVNESRIIPVRAESTEFINSGYDPTVTNPVLFGM